MLRNEASTESTKEQVGSINTPDGSTKKLRSVFPDLNIIVGEGDLQKAYECYSQIMASYSGYIDTALTMPMREQETRTLTFPEIHPDDWEKMISYLLPGAAPPQSVADVGAVLRWYDKYDFDAGLEICDKALGGIDYNATSSSNFQNTMAAVELVYHHFHRMSLSRLKAHTFLTNLLEPHSNGLQLFERRQVRQLIPALRTEPDLWTKIQVFYQFPDDANVDREKYLDCLLFPDLLLSCFKARSVHYSRYHHDY
jgi:hypothetical protein